MNMVNLLENCVRKYPQAPAITHGRTRLTYAELDARTNRLAHALLALGVRRGDTVGLALYNGNHFVEGMYAAWKIAAVPANISYRYVEREMIHVVRKGCIETVILDEELVGRFLALRSEATLQVGDRRKVTAYRPFDGSPPPSWWGEEARRASWNTRASSGDIPQKSRGRRGKGCRVTTRGGCSSPAAPQATPRPW